MSRSAPEGVASAADSSTRSRTSQPDTAASVERETTSPAEAYEKICAELPRSRFVPYRAGLLPGEARRSPMRTNRSIPSSTVIPVLIYPDVREAVAWLEAAFGFVERVRIGEDHRSQLKVGDGAVIIGDVRRERRPPRAGRGDALGDGAGRRRRRPLRAGTRATARAS